MNPQKVVAHRVGIAYVLRMPVTATNHPVSASPSNRKPSRTDATRLPLRWAGKSRSREGELYRRFVRQLVQHVGRPNHAQEMLIGRIAWLQVHLASMDQRILESGEMSEHTGKQYLAWANSVSRMIAQLGLHSAPEQPPSLADYLSQWRAPDAAAGQAEPSQARERPARASRSSEPVAAAEEPVAA